MSPRRLFRTFALAEAVTWSLLLAGMAQKYLLDAGEWGVTAAGALHGFVFLAFVVTVLLVAVNQRWPRRVTLLARPRSAAAVAAVGVALAFAGLLVVGPPGGGSGAAG